MTKLKNIGIIFNDIQNKTGAKIAVNDLMKKKIV